MDIEHWLSRLIDETDSDVARIIAHAQVDVSRLQRDLQRAMSQFQSGNTRAPSLHRNILALNREAWLTASIDFGASQIRSGHLLISHLKSEDLQGLAREASAEWKSISVETVMRKFREITGRRRRGSRQCDCIEAAGDCGGDGGALARFTIDLTARARKGELDQVLGRDGEIRQMLDIRPGAVRTIRFLSARPGLEDRGGRGSGAAYRGRRHSAASA